ncbi:MAG: KdsC family phosphatase [Thermoanaerobaculia bacterium]
MVTSDLALAKRASGIRLVLTDCDGVLTDNGVYVTAAGAEIVRFSRRDGLGVERLRTLAGVETGIVSREISEAVAKRAQKLGITELHLGVADKEACVLRVAAARNLDPSRIAFIGDDVNDLAALAAAGFSAAPADAIQAVRRSVHYVCPSPGGHGAFRDVAELILAALPGETLRESPKGGSDGVRPAPSRS